MKYNISGEVGEKELTSVEKIAREIRGIIDKASSIDDDDPKWKISRAIAEFIVSRRPPIPAGHDGYGCEIAIAKTNVLDDWQSRLEGEE